MLRVSMFFATLAFPRLPVRGQSPAYDSVHRRFTGTWYLVTHLPAYDDVARDAPTQQPSKPVLVPRSRIVWGNGLFPVKSPSDPEYPLWLELNPRDSITLNVRDSTVTVLAGAAPPITWFVDGKWRITETAAGEMQRVRAA